jgi:hypothetical protein
MTNVEKYVEHVKHIQQFEDRWSSERQSHEHDVRRELRAKLTFEEVYMKKPKILYESDSAKATYYPEDGEVSVCDKLAPALSDSCMFFEAREFLKLSRSAAKKLTTALKK